MSRPRLEIQKIFEDILGTRNVYFQPPESVKLSFPCIIYHLNNSKDIRADDRFYSENSSYTVTLVDKNPDSTLPAKIKELPYCSLDRVYTADNLNHFTFTLYF